MDTHAHEFNRTRDSLAPDLALCDEGVGIDAEKTCFPRISTFVEFKAEQCCDMDPFEDSEDPSDMMEDFSFECGRSISQYGRGATAMYAANILGSQFRTHILSVSICEENACFIRWDSGPDRRHRYIKIQLL